MQYTFIERLKNGWNAFTSRDPTDYLRPELYYGSSYRPDRRRGIIGNDGSIIDMVKNRIAVDVSLVDIHHVKLDEEDNFKEILNTPLNDRLANEANIDQTGRAFIQDLVQSLFDEGCIAAVPIDTDVNPKDGSFKIDSIRVGQIIDWYPYHVKIRAFNEQIGRKDDFIAPKSSTPIIENPFYNIMNAPNSTLQRLIRTLRNLDVMNDQNASGKLDLIIQLPYSLRSPLKQQQAEARRKQVEMQLVGSKYGIAYTDASERITQLNRPVENNLWKEAQDLTAMLFNQLGLTQSIFDGTADAKTLNNYYNRTIEPILIAIVEEMRRKFLTKTARSQHQSIIYIRDVFKSSTVDDIAKVAQILTQNEIMSSNEIRSKLGLKPVENQRADELLNKNINKVGAEQESASAGINADNPDLQNETEDEDDTE